MSATNEVYARTRQSWLFWIAVGSIAFVILFPFKTTVVPAWKIRVIDEDGKPIAGTSVREYWHHYSVESEGHEQDLSTDDNGYVTFPSCTVRASIVRRIAGPILNVLDQGAHASFGPSAMLMIWQEGFEPSYVMYAPNESLPEQIILQRRK